MAAVTCLDMATPHRLIAGRKMVISRIIPAERLRQTKIPVVVDRTKTDNPTSQSICGSGRHKLAFDGIIAI